MKFIAATLLLLLSPCTASKVRNNLRQTQSGSAAKSSPCPDGVTNRFPDALLDEADDGIFKLLGKVQAPQDGVFSNFPQGQNDSLTTALKADADFVIGKRWMLKMKVINDGDHNRTFGFQGGGGSSGGFLTFNAAPGTHVIDIQDNIASADHTEFQYRGATGCTQDANCDQISSGEILMSDICLAPVVCKSFVCPTPTATPRMFKLLDDQIGSSDAECCELRKCKAENVQCTPATQYANQADYDSRAGYTVDECCTVKNCPTDICNETSKWSPKSGTGLLGSTVEECCDSKECRDWPCTSAPNSKWKKKQAQDSGDTAKGSSDLECCDKITCDSFVLPYQMRTVFKMKANAAEIQGDTLAECCDSQMCKDYDCPDNTQWKPIEGNLKAGSTTEECCEKQMCSTFNCSKSGLQPKRNRSSRQGQSDEECCELKFCKDHTCSDATKWVHFSDLSSTTDVDRRGDSDRECCEPIMCQVAVCSPVTAWKPKADITNIQGSTRDQCCRPFFCGDFRCATDADGDGVGTKWYKRIDTNAYKFQGSTDEECCLPKYCSQYSTSAPTEWKRKPDKNALGSTDVECYDQKYCSEYCCIGDNMILKPNSQNHVGSTDRECCLDRRTIG